MPLFILTLILAVAAYFIWRTWTKRQTRKALLATHLTPMQRTQLKALAPLVSKLPPEIRKRYEGKINLFLNQVDFIGCDDLEVTDEMRLSIAGQACLLVANIDAWFDPLTTVLVYPNAFKSMDRKHEGYVVTEVEVIRSGESWSRGPVVLSWAHSHQGGLNDKDGHNVVLHEFAHRIDDLSGHTDGVPLLQKTQSYEDWTRVFRGGFERLTNDLNAGKRTTIDPYGATGHEEYFAVSVELFFERPGALFDAEPEVYTQLSQLFQLDPRSWR